MFWYYVVLCCFCNTTTTDIYTTCNTFSLHCALLIVDGVCHHLLDLRHVIEALHPQLAEVVGGDVRNGADVAGHEADTAADQRPARDLGDDGVDVGIARHHVEAERAGKVALGDDLAVDPGAEGRHQAEDRKSVV